MACFEPRVPMNRTLLQAYNCNGDKASPAEKQIYRPSFVKQHFVHYSTVTSLSEMNKTELEAAGFSWNTKIFPGPYSRYANDLEEATMLHAKAVAPHYTSGWEKACRQGYKGMLFCDIGNPLPDNVTVDTVVDNKADLKGDESGWAYNCHINKRVEEYWVPRLENALKQGYE